MAKRIRRTAGKQKTINVWWVRLLLSAGCIVLAYIFASLAIDSGSLLEYAICLVLIYWAIANAARGVRFAFAR